MKKATTNNRKRFYRVNGIPNLLWVSMNNYAEYIATERNYNLIKNDSQRNLVAKLCYGKFSYEITQALDTTATWFKDMTIDEVVASISINIKLSRNTSKKFGDLAFRKEVLGKNLK